MLTPERGAGQVVQRAGAAAPAPACICAAAELQLHDSEAALVPAGSANTVWL